MKLIDKDAVVAEIEKLINRYDSEYDEDSTEVKAAKGNVCHEILCTIDSFEVKEVDLEDGKKEELAQKYIDYTFKRHNIDPESKEGQLIYYAYMHGMNQCLTQLRTQKGEEV